MWYKGDLKEFEEYLIFKLFFSYYLVRVYIKYLLFKFIL